MTTETVGQISMGVGADGFLCGALTKSLNVGDYLEGYVWHNNGVSADIWNGVSQNFIVIHKLS